ncbi:MAG: 30S ribosomal protein S18 [Leptospiraceae bacterium]|nr:30S ribosomal protein S18 [Leptospiraceae bacterium]MDW8307597.1 30S ribosomal protein S18 [Leptospiraceae bacterium]
MEEIKANEVQEEKKGVKSAPSRFRRRTCRFCENKNMVIDYKRVDVLIKLVSNRGKILPRRLTGTCAKHQRQVARAIKRARMAGFLPFTSL